MRRLIFIPLLLLVACSLPKTPVVQGGGGATAKSKEVQTVTAITSGAIETKILPPQGQAAPLSVNDASPPPHSNATPKATPLAVSPEEVECRTKGGQWAKAARLAAMTCYIPSKDAGKSCSKQGDCSSQCLARSRTCAPIWPIFGCSAVLQNDGSLVTLCID